MKHALVLLFLLASGTYASGEPILGGPCEGCENVFVGLPDTLTSQARLAPIDEPGDAMVIEGTVRGLDGKPAPNIIVYAYQTNALGLYPTGTTRHGSLRAWVETDELGHYRFDTIRPGGYPGSGLPEHVHMHVIEPGTGTYYIDDVVFDDDPRLTLEEQKSYEDGRGGSGLTSPKKDDAGVWWVRRDIFLGAGIPGYDTL